MPARRCTKRIKLGVPTISTRNPGKSTAYDQQSIHVRRAAGLDLEIELVEELRARTRRTYLFDFDHRDSNAILKLRLHYEVVRRPGPDHPLLGRVAERTKSRLPEDRKVYLDIERGRARSARWHNQVSRGGVKGCKNTMSDTTYGHKGICTRSRGCHIVRRFKLRDF